MEILKYSEVCRYLRPTLLFMVAGNKRFMVGQPQLADGLINVKFFDTEEEARDGIISVKIDPSFPTMIIDCKS